MPDPSHVLVTGGAGYIGAHTAKALSEAGYIPVTFDNLSSGFEEAVRWGPLVRGDIRDADALFQTLADYRIQAVIHFAGLIEVGRSSIRPDLFYDVNVGGTASLLAAMRRAGASRLVFSSSAAVYGQSPEPTLREDAPKNPASPYGDTKLAGERMIAAHCKAFGLQAIALRYFNAAGADPSGLIGEAHFPETHLIPLAIAAALGVGKPLTVFGQDFPTPDGTCLRDYIHVNDLASAHVKALEAPVGESGFEAMNVGTGQGRSVMQVLEAVGEAVGRPAPHSIGGRRDGDPAALVADPAKAGERLGWSAQHSSLRNIVETAASWARRPLYGHDAHQADAALEQLA
ncbi:MAG TPA: UDP-glucose 4-epimerase GalE [Caulobacter sp.]|nr:UDP-glucose 4-epimerase GalE [Caulobacter sp.]